MISGGPPTRRKRLLDTISFPGKSGVSPLKTARQQLEREDSRTLKVAIELRDHVTDGNRQNMTS
jgi:hypothetical protein